jgi:hypothetical protein
MHTYHNEMAGVSGIVARNPGDIVAHRVMSLTVFSLTEQMNRTLGAGAALNVYKDIAYKVANGRLRGLAYARARRQMADMGLNLDELAKNNFHVGNAIKEQEILNKVVWRGTQLTQYVPDITRVPTLWTHPIGRLAVQFKSFAFNHTKFVRDAILREAVEGNMKPLLTMATLYPTVGGVVKGSRDFFREEARDSESGLRTIADNFAAVGGFGLMMSSLTSLQYGKGLELFAGPSAGDAAEYASLISNLDTDGMARELERSPTWQAGRTAFQVGAGATMEFFEAMKDVDVGWEDGIEDNLQNRILNKERR